MKPLKTLKGNKIWYSKFGVGKQMGSKIYFHISLHDQFIPADVWEKVEQMWDHLDWMSNYNNPHKFNTVCYDLKKPNVVRLDTCPNFDTDREPMVGMTYAFDTENDEIHIVQVNQVFHHKWLWVTEDYEGFDVQESYEWSNTWLNKLNEPASGYINKWSEQLRKVGLYV